MYSMPLTDSDREFIKGVFLHLHYQQAIFTAAKALRKLMKEAFLSVQDHNKLQFIKENKEILPPELRRRVKICLPDFFCASARALHNLGFDLESLANMPDDTYNNNILAAPIRNPARRIRRSEIFFIYDNDEEDIPLINTREKKRGITPFSTRIESNADWTTIVYQLNLPLEAIEYYPKLSKIMDEIDSLDNLLRLMINDIKRKADYVSNAVTSCRTTKQLDRLYPLVSDTLDYVYTQTHMPQLQGICVVREAETISESVRQAVDILAKTYEWPRAEKVESVQEAS